MLPLIAFLVQAAASASPSPVPQPPATILVEPAAAFLAACDADADALTTRAERDAGVARAFAPAEAAAGERGVGYIAYAEWARRWLGDANALPGPYEVDADGDNRITAAELERRFTALFDRYDMNKDGALTRAELVTVRARPPGEEDGRGRERGRRR
ncbi:EF-hand domain-containing protein [uncultured Sphingomonas sp.]|uniref:EF-hand domain-containing protein n=1 Tax=uncultured Sphingomonas sp. TaxID=158754 RepID=UPI0035CA0BD6